MAVRELSSLQMLSFEKPIFMGLMRGPDMPVGPPVGRPGPAQGGRAPRAGNVRLENMRPSETMHASPHGSMLGTTPQAAALQPSSHGSRAGGGRIAHPCSSNRTNLRILYSTNSNTHTQPLSRDAAREASRLTVTAARIDQAGGSFACLRFLSASVATPLRPNWRAHSGPM